MHIRVGTRGSKLALAQCETVIHALQSAHPEYTFETVMIHTKGDVRKESLSKIGGNGLFIREIEEELVSGNIDMAVHSMKDLPSSLHEDLMITGTLKREEPQDVLVLKEEGSLQSLKEGAVIATGSVRRQRQLSLVRPDLVFEDIRGNIDTRLKKMEENGYDGLVLAKAGLNRLHMQGLHIADLSDVIIPSPCQGALAIEIRKDREDLKEMMKDIEDTVSSAEVLAERTFLREMHADCRSPVAAHAHMRENGTLTMRALYGNETLYTAEVSGDDPVKVGRQAAFEITSKMAGKVYLVGGGPGDPEYITLKGLNAIKEADCVVYDRLAPASLLKYCRKDCEIIYAGKQSHTHTMKQYEICSLLVEKALRHRTVVRLHGGDPFVLGRGQEEVNYLKEHGVSYEVISGLSSCIAGPASAGIPLTSRGVSTGFHVLSAHTGKDAAANLPYDVIAESSDTWVFLMGMAHRKEIASKLLEAGMKEDTPFAVLSNVTCDNQRDYFTTLKEAAVEDIDLPSPGILVVGNCVSFHEEARETEMKRKDIYLPKIGYEPSRLAGMIHNRTVHEITVSEISYLPYDEDVIPDVALFTSRNGVDGFFQGLKKDIRLFANTRFAAVGKSTALRLKEYGITPDFIPEVYNSDALLEGMSLKREDTVCHYTGTMAGPNNRMYRGFDYRCVPVYDNRETEIIPMTVREDAEFIFTCASNAERMMHRIINFDDWKEHGTAYVIGPSTEKKCRELGIRNIICAKEATYASLSEAIV